ncbi:MAG: hypothetical protein CVU38_20955 [Chloroflexi bacterium HGW-Chloroflexi-1]|nr:MAG: hypothetical protein CVU38_20955 [Chloroflexi bacterium HGW-Chloroflexi-1]
MTNPKLSGLPFCQAFMHEVCRAIYAYARGKTGLLRYGPQTPVQEETGKTVLKLRSANLTEEQIYALEGAFQEVQVSILARLFSLIDGSSQPPGWPDEIRLVNTDTGEEICPDGLEWVFGLALAEYRDRSMASGQA